MGVYRDIYSHSVSLLAGVLIHYTNSRDLSFRGSLESDVIREYGKSLYYLALLEIVTDNASLEKSSGGVEWALLRDGVKILSDYHSDHISGDAVLERCSYWVKSFYPFFTFSRIFDDAMHDSRHWLIEKHGY